MKTHKRFFREANGYNLADAQKIADNLADNDYVSPVAKNLVVKEIAKYIVDGRLTPEQVRSITADKPNNVLFQDLLSWLDQESLLVTSTAPDINPETENFILNAEDQRTYEIINRNLTKFLKKHLPQSERPYAEAFINSFIRVVSEKGRFTKTHQTMSNTFLERLEKTQNSLFEAILKNPWDAQYEALFKEFIALKDPGTKIESGKSSALNDKTITRQGIRWTISYHRPDSSWGSWWDVFSLIAIRISDNKPSFNSETLKKFEVASASILPTTHPVTKAFMARSARFQYPNTPEVQEWQKKNIENFKDMLKFIKSYDEKRDKLFEKHIKRK